MSRTRALVLLLAGTATRPATAASATAARSSPDEPGAGRPDALHDELRRQPPGQRAEHRGRGEPGTAVLGKVSCLDQRLDSPGLELPVD